MNHIDDLRAMTRRLTTAFNAGRHGTVLQEAKALVEALMRSPEDEVSAWLMSLRGQPGNVHSLCDAERALQREFGSGCTTSLGEFLEAWANEDVLDWCKTPATCPPSPQQLTSVASETDHSRQLNCPFPAAGLTSIAIGIGMASRWNRPAVIGQQRPVGCPKYASQNGRSGSVEHRAPLTRTTKQREQLRQRCRRQHRWRGLIIPATSATPARPVRTMPGSGR